MTQKEPILERNNLALILFFVLQAGIIYFSFKEYVNIIEGVAYYSEGSIMLGAFFSCINSFLFVNIRSGVKWKAQGFQVFCFSLFSIFATAAIIKENTSSILAQYYFTASLSLIFLLFGMFSLLKSSNADLDNQ
ncbi:MAG TPA: hypothetical protein VHK69_17540 [Chitinophagaceae bacterium]|jgi:hypothetical protein|nr:hypothetical protein [Chitinophagaceae bacterium]